MASVPPVYTPEQWSAKTAGRSLHELGPVSNICADWGNVLSQGLLERKRVALETRQRLLDEPEAVEFLDSAIETINAVLSLAARYANVVGAVTQQSESGITVGSKAKNCNLVLSVSV